MPGDPHNLNRFLLAQQDSYSTALAELRRGQKRSHWIWFIFPQVQGLGHSPTAQLYAIGSAEEARACLEHPVLGSRLQECARALLDHRGTPIRFILAPPDDLKLRSSMTLFAQLSPPDSVFHQVLEEFYDGRPDEATLQFLHGR